MSHNDVGDELLVRHEVRDRDGQLVDADTVTLTVTRPDLTTELPVVANPPEATGRYEAAYTLGQAGRYVFAWSTTGPDTASSSAIVAVEPGAPPTAVAIREYLGDAAGQWSDPEIEDALAAELAAQSRVCRVGAIYPADLAEALKRRVARNLSMRALPLAVLQGDAEAGNMRLPGRDPEVRRLEAAHRKLVAG